MTEGENTSDSPDPRNDTKRNDPADVRADRDEGDQPSSPSSNERTRTGAGREANPYDKLPAPPAEPRGEVH